MTQAGKSSPRISVVMATYNRAEVLPRTIRHLSEQTLAADEFEVIIIDDGSSDDTRAVVAAERANLAFRLEYLHHDNQGPGYTENRGIRAARAPIVLLMADDIFLAPGALAAHLEQHSKHPEQEAAVLGRVLQSPELDGSVFIRTWDPFQMNKVPGDMELPYHMFWACNISFKAEFMLRHGMFRDQRGHAGAAAHEDVELGYRLHAHGLRIFFSRDAMGHHYHFETLAGTIRRARERGFNWLDFKRLVPEPEIAVRYRVLARETVRDHIRAFAERRQYLMPDERNPWRLGLRYLVRFLVFNRLTVNLFWLPLMNQAEKNRWLAGLMRSAFYRGIYVYNFSQAIREGRRGDDATGRMDKIAEPVKQANRLP